MVVALSLEGVLQTLSHVAWRWWRVMARKPIASSHGDVWDLHYEQRTARVLSTR